MKFASAKLLLLSVFFFLVQCSSHYAPDCDLYNSDQTPTEEQLTEQARQAWDVLKVKRKESLWPQATKNYNKAVYALAEKLLCDKMHSGSIEFREHPFVIHRSYNRSLNDNHLYENIILADKVDLDILEESVTIPGVGVPLVAQLKKDEAQSQQSQINDSAGIHTVTAILDFDNKENGKPVLKLVPRYQNEFIRIGKQKQNLAANFSAPIAYLWKQTHVDDKKLLGLFRPSETVDTMGLFFHEAYDPNKIPVIFTHGLQSSPETFSNLSNRLVASPEIRKNYQFWYFGYPTGISWVISSDAFRKAIHDARNKFDPKRKDKSFDQMILIGHSMGGLVTRFSMSENSWGVIRYTLKKKEQKRLQKQGIHYFSSIAPGSDTDKMLERINFQPLSYPKRVVFLATPHKGSDFANNWIARLGIALIKLPQNILEETYSIVTLNKNIFAYPEELLGGMSSISQLSPDNAMILGLNDLRISPKIPAHSVIGDRGHGDTPDSSDGFVKYKSSHLDWSVSEKIVPASHSVQDNPQTAEEIHRILFEHLKAQRGRQAFRFPEGRPIPAICLPTDGNEDSEKHFFSRQDF